MATAARPGQGAEVISDPEILGGLPVVRGTRVPAAQVLAELRAGSSPDEIRRHYPSLPLDGIDACLAWERGRRRRAV